MRKSAAIEQAARRAAKLGRPVYVVKDGLAPDDQWEVCTSDFDLDTWYAGASCVHEVDSDGLVPEQA
jgi:nicotinamidase-related amidase